MRSHRDEEEEPSRTVEDSLFIRSDENRRVIIPISIASQQTRHLHCQVKVVADRYKKKKKEQQKQKNRRAESQRKELFLSHKK